MATSAEILAAIQPFLIESNKINPTTPLLDSYGVNPVYIYRIPGTNPQALVFQSSAAIDCDGLTSSQCNITTDPAYTADTSFHTSTDQPLDAASLPFYVLPATGTYFNYLQNNISGGQLGIVMYGSAINAAVFGDENAEPQAIGEVSYALASSLGIDPNPSTGGIESGVTYIIFTGPSSVVNPIENHATAVSMGNAAISTMLSQIAGGGGGTPGYNCVNGACQYVASGAQYGTLAACQAACQVGGTPGYNCVNGACQYVASGAQYGTLAACQAACQVGGTPGYNCVNGACQYVASGAQFGTLPECQAACTTGGGGGGCTADQFTILNKCYPKNTVYAGLAGVAALAWIIALTKR